MMKLFSLVLIAGLGAMMGSMLRFALLELAPKWFGSRSQLMVLVINFVAAFGAGLFYGVTPASMNTLITSGVIGGFSTFSAPIVDFADGMTSHNQRGRAFFKISLVMIGGLICFQVGLMLSQIF